jgi:hypothetical protein
VASAKPNACAAAAAAAAAARIPSNQLLHVEEPSAPNRFHRCTVPESVFHRSVFQRRHSPPFSLRVRVSCTHLMMVALRDDDIVSPSDSMVMMTIPKKKRKSMLMPARGLNTRKITAGGSSASPPAHANRSWGGECTRENHGPQRHNRLSLSR